MTARIERRSISELITLYSVEPELRDVFVEGRDDAALVRWYLRHRAARDFIVYEISGIEISPELVAKHGFDLGNRGQVQTLAQELSKRLTGKDRKCATLVIDADFDHIEGNSSGSDLLLVTDFSCLEAYLFSEESMDKLLSVVLMGCCYSAKDVLGAVLPILRQLFLYRWANYSECIGLSWISSFVDLCALSGSIVHFDEAQFVQRYAQFQREHIDRLTAKVDSVASTLTSDLRNYINGHDSMIFLRWYLRHVKVAEPKPLTDERAFCRAFFGCIEATELDHFPFFGALTARVAS